MIKEESLNGLAQLAGIESQVLLDAIRSEDEVEIPVPTGVVYTPEKIEELKANVLKENQGTY